MNKPLSRIRERPRDCYDYNQPMIYHSEIELYLGEGGLRQSANRERLVLMRA